MEGRPKRSLTIRSEIFLLSFAFLAIVSLIFAGIFLHLLYQKNMNSARNSLRECNSQIVTYTEGMFHENAAVLGILSRDTDVVSGGNGNPDNVLSIYNAILKDSANITYICSGYADGRLYISGHDTPANYSPTVRPWYRAAMATSGVARLVYSDASTGEWLFSQSKKLVDPSGRIVGVVSINCSNESISRQLSARYQYDSQRSYIMDPSGTVLIHPEEKYINDSLLNYMEESIWEAVINGTSNYGEYQKNEINSMAYFERIPGTGFIVATAINASEVTNPIFRSMEYLLGLVVCLSILLGFILSRVLIYRLARPVMALKSRIEKVAGGCPSEAQDFGFSNAEINDIADSIEIIVKDIAKREEQRKAAEYLSFHDSMTGLYNRRFFDAELQHLDTRRNHPLCVICCDVNGLKLVNDVFGHDVGDRLIRRVADCLSGACRSGGISARTGGDEFALLLPRTPPEAAQEILDKIRNGFSGENICGAEVSASLGYGIRENAEESLEEVLRRADKMMYARKLTESAEMKRRTVTNIIDAAAKEGLAAPLTPGEEQVLNHLAAALCPEASVLLRQGYRLRNIGLCTLFQTGSANSDSIKQRHTENGYRILSALEEYRGVAGYVLHYTEHWDGSGWPAGLAGTDIPLLSRIIAAAAAYFAGDGNMDYLERQESWYDPEIVSLLSGISGPCLPLP